MDVRLLFGCFLRPTKTINYPYQYFGCFVGKCDLFARGLGGFPVLPAIACRRLTPLVSHVGGSSTLDCLGKCKDMSPPTCEKPTCWAGRNRHPVFCPLTWQPKGVDMDLPVAISRSFWRKNRDIKTLGDIGFEVYGPMGQLVVDIAVAPRMSTLHESLWARGSSFPFGEALKGTWLGCWKTEAFLARLLLKRPLPRVARGYVPVQPETWPQR